MPSQRGRGRETAIMSGRARLYLERGKIAMVSCGPVLTHTRIKLVLYIRHSGLVTYMPGL